MKLKTKVYGIGNEELNILLWAGCSFQHVYDKGSKAEATRKRLYSWIFYPEGTIIEEDSTFEMIEGLHTRLPELIVLPNDLPRLVILWGSVPEERIEYYPFYFVDDNLSSEKSLDWYYYSQHKDEYDIPHMRMDTFPPLEERYFLCNCCGMKTFYTPKRSYDYRKHQHHLNCIHLKKKVR